MAFTVLAVPLICLRNMLQSHCVAVGISLYMSQKVIGNNCTKEEDNYGAIYGIVLIIYTRAAVYVCCLSYCIILLHCISGQDLFVMMQVVQGLICDDPSGAARVVLRVTLMFIF